ncbi:hypothetical protein MSIMFB_00002 [Mycobacterium simulans]|uniref:Uncharacterized protein n=1 Tax=Mycobacterium simulans TaxID=627089 RepID=A0A7Z7IHE8_9MYCO|nr:hypothetical protein MSIMFB_00002 [Mycobacterium simulans]
MFCPKRFDNANDRNTDRFAATNPGSTVADNAASNAAAATLACPAAACAWAAVALSHPAYGAAAAAIATDDAPCHDPPSKPEVTDPNEAAADPSSAARPSHAVAAANNGPGPAPPYISTELISGGNT